MTAPKLPNVEIFTRWAMRTLLALCVPFIWPVFSVSADPFNPVAAIDFDVRDALFKGYDVVTTEISRTPAVPPLDDISTEATLKMPADSFMGGQNALMESPPLPRMPTGQRASAPEVIRLNMTLSIRSRSDNSQRRGNLERASPLRLPGGIAPGMAFIVGTNDCFSPNAPDAFYCLEAVPWPSEIADAFTVSTSLYRGAKALVRYRSNIADAVYVLFNAAHYDRVYGFLVERFGKPYSDTTRKVAFIGRPPADTPRVRWQSGTADQSILLEIKGIDDLRRMLPDPTTGVLQLVRPEGTGMFADLDPDVIMMSAFQGSTTPR